MSRFLRTVGVLLVGYVLGALSYREERALKVSQGPLGEMEHVGILVPDLDQAVAMWRAMGFDQITVLPPAKTQAEYHGAPIETELRKAFIQGTTPGIELIQPVDGAPNPWASELSEQGEVLHHIAYHVADAKAEMERLRQLGMVEIAGTRPADMTPGRDTWDYMKAPGSALIIELLSTVPKG